MLLAEDLVERSGPQASGQWGASFEPFGDRSGEEVVGHRSMLRPPRTVSASSAVVGLRV